MSIVMGAGWRHTCAAIEGRLACWGDNSAGQLGLNDTVARSTPTLLDFPFRVSAISANDESTCAIADGDAYCWGNGDSGRLGTGDSSQKLVPTLVTGLPAGQVTDVKTARYSTCAWAAGEVYCWGSNSGGRLGIDTSQGASSVPVKVTNLSGTVNRITAAADRACAVLDSIGYCWGHDHAGDLGTAGAGGWQVDAVIVQDNLSDLVLGTQHSCGIHNAALSCWGRGTGGELGHGLLTSSTLPWPVPLLRSMTTGPLWARRPKSKPKRPCEWAVPKPSTFTPPIQVADCWAGQPFPTGTRAVLLGQRYFVKKEALCERAALCSYS